MLRASARGLQLITSNLIFRIRKCAFMTRNIALKAMSFANKISLRVKSDEACAWSDMVWGKKLWRLWLSDIAWGKKRWRLFRHFKWSSGFSSWVNLILKAYRTRCFRIIRHSVVGAMPNSWERRGIDWFGSFWIDALTAAIISSLQSILRLFSTGTSNSVNLVSNLSTIARTAYRGGRLLRSKIRVSALKVATTDWEFR